MEKDIIDESIYLRVTTPLNRYSGYDAVPVAVLNYAADRGTRIHEYCDLYSLNMLFGEVDEDCIPYVQAYINWFDENVEEVVSTEERLFSDELKIQGQIDLIARVKGYEGTSVVDIKSSLKVNKTYNLQTAAYRHLCEVNGTGISHRLIVQVKKDGTFEVVPYDVKGFEYEEELTLYKGILEAHLYFS